MAPRGPVNFFSDTAGKRVSGLEREIVSHQMKVYSTKIDRERNELERKWRLNKTGFRFHNSHNRSLGLES